MSASNFTHAATIQFPNGKTAVIVADCEMDLEYAWRKLAGGRVPLRREMIERVEIKQKERK